MDMWHALSLIISGLIGWFLAEIIHKRPMIKIRVKRNKIDN